MEIRKEIKSVFDKNSKEEIIFFLNTKCKQLHPPRIVNSIYLDTNDFEIYKKNKIEDIDTYKFRFRFYGKENKESFFEKKYSLNGQKYKLKDENFSFSENSYSPYFYEKYILYPVTKVKFNRSYFKYRNIRVTIDSEIEFIKTSNKDLNPKAFHESKIIVEQKILDTSDVLIENNLLFRPEKYSKYMKSIEFLYPNLSFS